MLVKVEVEQGGERVDGTLFKSVQIQKKNHRKLEKFFYQSMKNREILSNKPLRQRCGHGC